MDFSLSGQSGFNINNSINQILVAHVVIMNLNNQLRWWLLIGWMQIKIIINKIISKCHACSTVQGFRGSTCPSPSVGLIFHSPLFVHSTLASSCVWWWLQQTGGFRVVGLLTRGWLLINVYLTEKTCIIKPWRRTVRIIRLFVFISCFYVSKCLTAFST